MKQSQVIVAISAAALLAAGCTHVTPYPSVLGTLNAERTAYDWACDAAVETAGDPDAVLACLLARGRGWEERGRRIRGWSSGLGQALIPATAAGVGLLAAGDTSDAVPILGLVSGAALTHSSAYARADMARLYEEATSAYRCLTTTVAAWNRSAAPLRRAKARVDAAGEAVEADLRDLAALSTGGERQTILAALDEVVIRREGVSDSLNTVEGATGLVLLDRADAIDDAVEATVATRLPDPRAVYAAASSQITAPGAAEGMDPVQPPSGALPPGGEKANAYNALSDSILRFNVAVAAFNEALETHDPSTDAQTRAASCTFDPAEFAVPALTAAPNEVILDDGVGDFVIRGGVAPFGVPQPPTGVRVTVTPLTSTSAHVRVRVEEAAGAGPWTLTVLDASPSATTVPVTVRKPDPEPGDEAEDDTGA